MKLARKRYKVRGWFFLGRVKKRPGLFFGKNSLSGGYGKDETCVLASVMIKHAFY
jgi:hypothetical protein